MIHMIDMTQIIEERKKEVVLNLTELEKDVLIHGFGENEFNSRNDETGVVWSWSIQGNCKITGKCQVAGVISSLVKKGLVDTWNYEDGKNPDNDVVALTEAGKTVFRQLKASA